ncbi:MAG: alanine--tRNA ligase [Solobacterium sp.]|jgi:alanyl-tRNA synthetase|nr:alanine--tRNA ligase [Solobacterium sp.]MCH4204996.1 alanine--tRNA ligase [Solobacterium sp.]MCH4226505.1 alanine--tRNA ligase [Solobacterium sp.]MCH4281789.1 alanine--tRNA ligase [Solobacterium sp.]
MKMEKKLTGNQIRRMFLDFWQSKGCMVEPGASLIPHNDPTLLWINAGVSALKKYFDGSEKPACNRICNSQKAIRTNDIENVGRTARHHTFFEMLGNFSIGDYFKTEAITWAWEFLTSKDWIGFDPERLYVTVYPEDHDAYDTWVKVGMIESHINKSSDNFWEIGRGPGGPDTEIYYDRGEKYDPKHIGEKLFFDDMENDRYVELWNIVFSQYDCRPGEMPRSEYKELPQKNIDTGMGLERLVCFIQEGETNFDTDLFLPIIHAAEKYAKHTYDEPEYKMAYRVVADHIRTVTFAIADGAMFSNEGRGYVLRRVLRRAVRYGIKLGIDGSFMYQLVQVVADNMKDYYPYIEEKTALISQLVKNEEESFHKTLANGEELLSDALKQHADTKKLPGEVVFKLYDTYGYPRELTEEIAQEAGYSIDAEGFEKEMKAQKERARAARGNRQSMHGQSKDLMDFTDESKFTGYTDSHSSGKVIGLFKDGVKVDELSDEGDVILSETCFYAESGGQCADTGKLWNDSFKADVSDVQKAPHKQPLHHIENVEGILHLGDTVEGEYNYADRQATRANHSSLHLLQAALKQVLGNHIAQAGSYNCPAYGRFDFTHFEKPSEEQLKQVERIVNEKINEDLSIDTEVLPIEEAKKTGATALFDEKYGDFVRVVSMGKFSKEFCGGTHASNTGDLGSFRIISEESVGSGIRRITCETKMQSYDSFKKEENYLNETAALLKMKNWEGLKERIEKLQEENADLQKQVNEARQKAMSADADTVISQAEEMNGLHVLILKLKDQDNSGLKSYAETLRNKMSSGIVFISNETNGTVTFVCAASKEAIAQGRKAGDIVKAAAQICGGNGGGRPDMAQAGGKDTAKIDEALASVRAKLAA